jgi:hypothetical protein
MKVQLDDIIKGTTIEVATLCLALNCNSLARPIAISKLHA